MEKKNIQLLSPKTIFHYGFIIVKAVKFKLFNSCWSLIFHIAAIKPPHWQVLNLCTYTTVKEDILPAGTLECFIWYGCELQWHIKMYKDKDIITQTVLFILCNAEPHLQQFEVLPLWDHDLIPNYLHPFLCVHGQVRCIYPGDITLIYLQQAIREKY